MKFLVLSLTYRFLIVELSDLSENLDAEVLLAHPSVRFGHLAAQIGLLLLHLESRS